MAFYDQEMEMLQGTIAAVVYQNYDNGYAVLRLKCSDAQTVTVVGTVPMPAVGEGLMVTGRWTSHSSYGRQFEAEFLERVLPRTSVEILQYLSSRIIKGIGPRTAARIVDKFGDRTLDIMEREPHRLAEVIGISVAKAKAIGEEFQLRVGMRQLMEFFAAHQLPAELAVQVYKRYGEKASDLLYDDPYLLMDEGFEAPFEAVDRFAIELGVAGEDPRRVEAGILFELRYNLTAGHSFLPEDKLQAATSQLLSVDISQVEAGIRRLVDAQRLVEDTLSGIAVIYLPQLYEAECFIQQRLLAAADLRFPQESRLEQMLRIASEHSDEGKRADAFISERSDLTRSAAVRLIEENAVILEGSDKEISKKYKIRRGDVLLVRLPEPEPCEAQPEDIPIDVIYEDDDIIVVNKPEGMVVHPAAGNPSGTLVNALLYHCKEGLSGIGGVIRPGIVHRIDKDTGGLLVVAKNDAAHLFLAEEIKHHRVERVYHAIVRGNFREDSGTVDAPIGRHPIDRKKMAVIRSAEYKSREAITHWSVLERFGQFTHIECRLETGRTHQIRVHMSSIGHPLVGDTVYGGGGTPFEARHKSLICGQCLFASRLMLTHPRTKERMEFSAALPENFSKLLEILGAAER